MRRTLLAGASAIGVSLGLAFLPMAFAQQDQSTTGTEQQQNEPSTGATGTEQPSDPAAGTDQPSDPSAGTDQPSGSSTDTEQPADTQEPGDEPPAAATPDMAPAEEGEETAQPTGAITTDGVQPANSVLGGVLIGASVVGADGEDLATVDDLVMSPEGEVTHLVVNYGGILGVGGKEVMVPWETATFDPTDGIVRVPASEADFESAPEFKTQEEVLEEQSSQAEEELRQQEAEQPTTD